MSTATRQDYATAAAAALLSDEARNPTYELGGPAYDVTGLAQLITDVTGTKVTYRDLSADGYAAELQRSGMDETTARFVAALDVAVARGDLQTSSTDLADLLGRPATGPADVVHAAYDLVKVTSRTAIIGLIGAGRIGGTLAGLAVDAGYHVVLSNDRGPATLSDLAARLGPSARAATPTEVAGAADLVVVAVPLSAYREIPAEQLVGKVVLDATNYMPDRDGHIAALDDESATSSQLLQARMVGSHLVKAFNTVFFGHLPTLARPRGAADRSSLAIAGDDQLAKNTAGAFIDASDTTPTTSACSAKAGASSPAPPHTRTVPAGPSTTRSRPRRSTSQICSRAPGTTATTELPRISPTNAHLGEPAVVMGALPGTVLREVPRSVTGSGTRQPPWPRLHAIALTRVPTEIPAWPRLLDRWTPDGGH